tara:strand:+ start:51211 stop:51495 length:285 start_codon:yes stop_codon:yes gene_type:complete
LSLVYPRAGKTAAGAEPLRVGLVFICEALFLMSVLVLAGGEIGLLLRYFTWLVFTRLFFTGGWTHAAALTWHPGLAHASVNYFLQGRGAVKGGV